MKNNLIENKRICFVVPGWVTKQTGGAELQTYYISEELIKRGWLVEVVTYKPINNNIFNSHFLNPNIKYHYYGKSKSSVLSILKAFYVLLRTKSKVYYLRTDALALKVALKFLFKLRNIKVFYALANDGDSENLGFQETILSKKYFRKCDLYMADILNTNSIKIFNKIICQTEDQKRILENKTGILGTLIYNSFNYNDLDEKIDKSKSIIWVGNMREVKNPEALFEILDKLELNDWNFFIIGKNREYSSHIKKCKNKRIQFFGELPYDKTLDYFKSAKLLVNTSFSEGFSNTFIQAWYYGVWIESLNVDPDKILSSKGFGDFYGNNLPGLIKAIQDIIDKKTVVNQNILNKAKMFSEENFKIVNNVKKLEELFVNSLRSP